MWLMHFMRNNQSRGGGGLGTVKGVLTCYDATAVVAAAAAAVAAIVL